jgi:2-dehydro-3-deoxyphosphogluconate aldolase/(4S)-4-hydroxy-2-oxoglutarate aldolase
MNVESSDARRRIHNAILKQKAIPVVRAHTPESALEICARLIGAGLDVVEITATIPDWKLVLATARREFPAATIGVGTIYSADDVWAAHDGGAHFIVSPFPVKEAREAAADAGTLFVGGGMTPAEIAASSKHGLCKLFPAHVGGPGYVRTLMAIMPTAQIMATGGIMVEAVGEWLAAGAAAVGIGSDLYGAEDFDAKLAALHDRLARA